jgi:hypothetical protein
VLDTGNLQDVKEAAENAAFLNIKAYFILFVTDKNIFNKNLKKTPKWG